jgi:hypothetical protein
VNEGLQIILFCVAFLAIFVYHARRALTQGKPIEETRQVGDVAGLTVVRVPAGLRGTLVGVRVWVIEDTVVVACMDARKARRLAGLLRNAARPRRGIPASAAPC